MPKLKLVIQFMFVNSRVAPNPAFRPVHSDNTCPNPGKPSTGKKGASAYIGSIRSMVTAVASHRLVGRIRTRKREETRKASAPPTRTTRKKRQEAINQSKGVSDKVCTIEGKKGEMRRRKDTSILSCSLSGRREDAGSCWSLAMRPPGHCRCAVSGEWHSGSPEEQLRSSPAS